MFSFVMVAQEMPFSWHVVSNVFNRAAVLYSLQSDFSILDKKMCKFINLEKNLILKSALLF